MCLFFYLPALLLWSTLNVAGVLIGAATIVALTGRRCAATAFFASGGCMVLLVVTLMCCHIVMVLVIVYVDCGIMLSGRQ